MRRLLPVLAILLLAAAADARVVQAPETERGGQTIPRGKAEPDCIDVAAFRCAAGFLGTAGFGWFPALDAEAVARWTAAGRAELAAGRPVWRSPRLVGRPARRLLLPRIQPRLH